MPKTINPVRNDRDDNHCFILLNVVDFTLQIYKIHTILAS